VSTKSKPNVFDYDFEHCQQISIKNLAHSISDKCLTTRHNKYLLRLMYVSILPYGSENCDVNFALLLAKTRELRRKQFSLSEICLLHTSGLR